MTANPQSPLKPLVDAVEGAAPLDAAGKTVAKTVRNTISPGPLKDALSGTWLGHALHPVLTDVVVGSFLSATMLDLLGGDDDGAAQRRLIGVGIAAHGPTALTRVDDWARAGPGDDARRPGGGLDAGTHPTARAPCLSSPPARPH